MSSDIPSEFSAHSGTTLDALGQAASKAEQAACRYRANTALPFTQLDFEAEHPEWSLSAHRTSSASSSRPASANGTMALFSRSSTSSASNRSLASANGRAASQAISIPSSPIQAVPRAQGRPRKPYPKEQGFSEPDKKQGLARDGMPRGVSTSQRQDDDLWSIYQEVVDPIIQSLDSHYEELYPQLDGSAIRQEVCQPKCTVLIMIDPVADERQVLDEIIEIVLPDLLCEKQHSKKHQKKVIRRFAKELWGQKILQRVSKQSSRRRSSSSHTPDLSLLGPGANSIQPFWGKSKSLKQRNHSISQLESIGLSPEPEIRPSKSARSCTPSGLPDVADQEISKTHKRRKALHNGRENNALPPESALKSRSDQRFWQGFEFQQGASNSSKNQISTSIKSPQTSTNPNSNIVQERLERHFSGGLAIGEDNSRVPQSSGGEPAGCFPNLSKTKSSKAFPPIPNKSRVGHPETIDTGQALISKFTSGFNLPKISNIDNHLDTGHDPRTIMTESNPIQIDSDEDGVPLPPAPPPAPPRARIVRRGTSGIQTASSRMAPSMRTLLPASRGPPSLISTAPPANFVFPSKSIKRQDYLGVDPALEQTLGALNVLNEQVSRPYRIGDDLKVKDDDTPGAVKHVDFVDTELSELLTIIYELQGSRQDSSTDVKDKLKGAVLNLSSSDIAEVARLANKTRGLLSLREQKSISRFLRHLQRDDYPTTPSIVRIEASKFGPRTGMTVQTLLRRREHGLGRDDFSIQRQLREAMIETFTPQRSWRGASGDIVAIACHPNSQTYTIGATSTSNAEDLQYNRPNNLLYGDVNHNTLHELPDHYIDRPKPNTIADGPNASEAVYAACDPKVYKTVSAIQYSPEGTRMFTASHDETVKIWDVTVNGLPSCNVTLAHDAILTQLHASSRIPNVLATGSQTTANAIRVYYAATSEPESPWNFISLGSTRAQAKPLHELFPECLLWGNTPITENLLLAGFARWGELPNNNPGREGDLCIWDLTTGDQLTKRPSSQSVTTACFHPFLNAFATGGAPGNRVTHRKTTRTVVRMWDMRGPSFSLEMECPALDIQDLVFHPRNKDIIAAGCTDGAVYIWDTRNPNHPLHVLQHGEPISDWDNKYGESPLSREQGDAGVTMTLWSKGKDHLYTGATDGMVKLWDINRAPEDVLIKDITQLEAAVASASFSPDFTYLMIGDSIGGVHLLSSGPGYLTADEQKFGKGPIQYVPTPRDDPPAPDNEPGQGQLAAQELLSSGQLTMHPIFGVGQGPAYAGPYAAYAHETGPPSMTRLLKDIERQQPVSRKTGRERDNAAAQNIIATHARRRYELSQNRQPSEEPSADPAVPKPAGESSKPSKKRKRSPRPNGYLEYLDRKKARTSKRAGDLNSDEAQDDGDGSVGGQADSLEDYDDETYEDDHWFPHMDLEVFEKLGINP